MAFLIALALLQAAPDDLASFLAALEKDRLKGVGPADLLKKLDAWAEGKPDEVMSRLAWNRALLATTVRLDELFVKGLEPRVGKQITLGRHTGKLTELKKDRLVLTVGGGQIILMFSEVPPDVRINDLKQEKLLPPKSFEESILRFSGSRTPAAISLPEAVDKDRVLAAIAGWVLQEADRNLATGGPLKAAEPLATIWVKEIALIDAAGGAIRRFLDKELSPKLVEEADAQLATNRKAARRMVELAADLCWSPAIVKQVTDRRWSLMDTGEWMRLPLETISQSGGRVEGPKIVCKDTALGSSTSAFIEFHVLPVPWEQISGVKAKMKPGSARYVDLRLGFGAPAQYHAAGYQQIGPGVLYAFYPGREEPGRNSSLKTIAKKPEYEFRAEAEKTKWKFCVDALEVNAVEIEGALGKVQFICDEGTLELTLLEVRKK